MEAGYREEAGALIREEILELGTRSTQLVTARGREMCGGRAAGPGAGSGPRPGLPQH